MFFDMPLQKNVKVTFLDFEKKRKKVLSNNDLNYSNSGFGKIGRLASEEVVIDLFKCKCLPYCYTPCLKKTVQTYFCQNFVKFRPIVKIFGKRIAKRTGFSEVYSFSTSPNLCQRTTMHVKHRCSKFLDSAVHCNY